MTSKRGERPGLFLSLVTLPIAAVLAAGSGAATPNESPPVHEPTNSAVITNGTIKLGVRDEGHLNIPGAGILSRPSDSTTAVGLRLIFPDGSESEATAPGCLCEGWGVAANGVAGWATVDNAFPAVSNLALVDFSATASEAVSVVDVGGTIRVTHDFHPSPNTPFLYEVTVSIENISGADIRDLRYRRVMDWDISPTTFNEFVTIDSGTAEDLAFVTDNGFDHPNPLLAPNLFAYTVGDRVDDGPRDHGALFQFEFADIDAATPLAPGEVREFNIYYGAAFNEPDANNALAAAGAEAFSFGQPNVFPDPSPGGDHGQPNTFIFAFGGIGGTAIFDDDFAPTCDTTFDAGPPSTWTGTATDSVPSEDVNGDGVLDPGEDLDMDGAIGEDTGVFGVALAPGALNMSISVDPFVPGDPEVPFSVSATSEVLAVAELVVTDGSGKTCTETLAAGSFDPDGEPIRSPTRDLPLRLRRPSPSTEGVRCTETDPDSPDFGSLPYVPFVGEEVEVIVPLTEPPGEKTVCCEYIDDAGQVSTPFCETVTYEGVRPVCDVDGNGEINRFDVGDIFDARGTAATGPDDPMDANGDGLITVNDSRECALMCDNPDCEPSGCGLLGIEPFLLLGLPLWRRHRRAGGC